MSMAWHMAMLSRTPPKKFPKHDKLMQRERSGKPQSQKQQMNIARLINAMYGGRVVSKSEG